MVVKSGQTFTTELVPTLTVSNSNIHNFTNVIFQFIKNCLSYLLLRNVYMCFQTLAVLAGVSRI